MKKFKIYNTFDFNNRVHDYNVTIETLNNGNKKITLFISDSGEWASECRGEEVFSLIDTGNGMIFPKKVYTNHVDYNNFAELFVLLSVLNKTEHLPIYKGQVEEEIIQISKFDI